MYYQNDWDILENQGAFLELVYFHSINIHFAKVYHLKGLIEILIIFIVTT